MCGVTGYLAEKPVAGLDAALRSMAAAIVHRGPDDEGFYQASARNGNGRVGLAHRRLSTGNISPANTGYWDFSRVI